jgi:hypothetical protein
VVRISCEERRCLGVKDLHSLGHTKKKFDVITTNSMLYSAENKTHLRWSIGLVSLHIFVSDSLHLRLSIHFSFHAIDYALIAGCIEIQILTTSGSDVRSISYNKLSINDLH